MVPEEISPEATWFAVVEAYQRCTRQYERMLQHFGLTIAQFDTLSAIDRLGAEALPKHIADRLLVTRGNVTGVLKRLAAAGLVRMAVNEADARSRVATLTSKGEALLRETTRASKRFIREQLAPFDAEERRRTRDSMRRMSEHLETLDPALIARGIERSR